MHEHKGAFMSTSSHPILLAALDLDGTLLNSSGEVTDYTRKVLSEASDRGVVVIPATGRPLASLPPVGGAVLVLISVLLTVLAGLIPANAAKKKDPVVALRTE